MRLSYILLFTGTLGFANTIANPSFGQPETNCTYSHSAPYTTSTCPVIGDPLKFDIQSISVSAIGNTVTATIDFNYGGGSSLAPFTDSGVKLQPGDLMFFDPSDPSQKQQYAVALYASRPNSLNNFIAGDLYKIGGNISIETAATALGDPKGTYYRPTDGVLMVDNSVSSAPAVAGIGDGVSVAALGNGKSQAEYAVTVQFNAPGSFMTMMKNGSIGVDFASADCGNAVLDGVIPGNPNNQSPAPEPEDMGLMGLGLLLVGGAGYWRKRSSRQAS